MNKILNQIGGYMEEQKKKLNLFQKLVEVRKDVIYIQKDTSGFNFKYANTTELLGKIRPKMDELGLLLVVNMEEFELIPWKKGNMEIKIPHIKISYTWIDADEPEQVVRTNLDFFEDKMSGCQGIGSLLTYAERYFLYKFFQIATDQDAPEEYYKRHALQPLYFEQNRATTNDLEVVREISDREICEEVAQIIWDGLKEKIPSLEKKYCPALPNYLFELKQCNPEINLREKYSQKCSDPEKFLEKLNEWEAKQLQAI